MRRFAGEVSRGASRARIGSAEPRPAEYPGHPLGAADGTQWLRIPPHVCVVVCPYNPLLSVHMTTRRVELRMKADLADWADAYAAERGSSRTAVIEAALTSLREDAARGVPDLERPSIPDPGHTATRAPVAQRSSGGAAKMPARARSASDRDAAAVVSTRPAAAAPAIDTRRLLTEAEKALGLRPASIASPARDDPRWVARVRLDVVVARMGMVARSERLGPIAPVDLGRAKSRIKAGGVLVNEVVERDPGRLIGEEMVALA